MNTIILATLLMGGGCYSPCYPKPVTVSVPAPVVTTTHDNHTVSYTYHVSYNVPAAPQGFTSGGYGIPSTREALNHFYAGYNPGESILQQIQANAAAAQHNADATARTLQVKEAVDAQYERVAALESANNGQVGLVQAMTGLVSELKQAIATIRPDVKQVVAERDKPTFIAQGTPLKRAQDAVNRNCLQCHQGAQAADGLDLTDITRLRPEQISNDQGDGVLDRILTTDQTKRMPKGKQMTVPDAAAIVNGATGSE